MDDTPHDPNAASGDPSPLQPDATPATPPTSRTALPAMSSVGLPHLMQATNPREAMIEQLQSGEAHCLRCGYALTGLDLDGACPECGTPVTRSLQGNLLHFSDPAYVRKLRAGLLVVVIGIVIDMLLLITNIAFGSFIAFQTGSGASLNASVQIFEAISTILEAAIAIALIFGWWTFSAPDPAFLGRESGNVARRIVRITAIIIAITLFVRVIFELAVPTAWAANVVGGLTFISWLAYGTKFFASMLYIRWIARRFPSVRLVATAERNMWMLPLIAVLGSVLFCIGPLIALTFYWVMLYEVQNAIKQVIGRQEMEARITAAAA
ncbi:MAG: hypothetical protein AAF432_02165 [Planctomycetota bacterium]